MKRSMVLRILVICGFIMFLILSWILKFEPGQEISNNFTNFLLEMAAIIPCAFILIGLFEVWVKRENVEKHLGEGSGIKGYIWAILLAGTTVGGIYLAFPVAYSLHAKGAKLSVVFTYIGASAILRIPMTVFEASFLGIKFTLVRMLVSLPLVVISSLLLAKYLSKRDYRIKEGG
jgi:uncharacterized membrane protein YraQ (UPF0718 family)